jgi:hypothetical protein
MTLEQDYVKIRSSSKQEDDLSVHCGKCKTQTETTNIKDISPKECVNGICTKSEKNILELAVYVSPDDVQRGRACYICDLM